ncbi:hypothetical protein HOG98_00375 [bacterium]|jgi:hypothetical protein|nr:hypothetical protein [bacterium]
MGGANKQDVLKKDQWGYGALKNVAAGKLYKLYDQMKVSFQDDCRRLSEELGQSEFDSASKERIDQSLAFTSVFSFRY